MLLYIYTGKDGMVTGQSFLQWEEVQALIDEDLITTAIVDETLKSITGSGAGIKGCKLNYDQFIEAFDALQEVADENDAAKDEELPFNTSSDSDPDDDDGSDSGSSSFRLPSPSTANKATSQAAKDYYNKNKSGPSSSSILTTKAIMSYNPIATLLSDDVLDKTALTLLIEETGADAKKGLNLDQFIALMEMLDEYTIAASSSSNDDTESSLASYKPTTTSTTTTSTSTTTTSSSPASPATSSASTRTSSSITTTTSSSNTDPIDLSDDEVTTLLKSVYDDLKNKKTNKVSIQSILTMDTIKDAINSKELSIDIFNQVLNEFNLKLSSEVDFKMFMALLDKLEGTLVYSRCI